MIELTPKEITALQRIDLRPELLPQFFKRIEGLKWFDELDRRGYFDPKRQPTQEKIENNRLHFPHWFVLDYLERTSKILTQTSDSLYTREELEEYANKFMELIRSVTRYAKKNSIWNFRTWACFAEVLVSIPSSTYRSDDVDIIRYWVEDPYAPDLVLDVLGQKLIPKLVNEDTHSISFAVQVVELSLESYFSANKDSIIERLESQSTLYHIRQFTQNVSTKLGVKAGKDIVSVSNELLCRALGLGNNDRSYIVWRPAIEENEQNNGYDSYISVLIDLYRDSLDGFVKTAVDEAREVIASMLNSDFVTVRRLAVHAIGSNFNICQGLYNSVLDSIEMWTYQFKHEIWQLLFSNYSSFDLELRTQTIERILSLELDEGVRIRSYRQAGWLAAIKDNGDDEEKLYAELVKKAGAEPDHPSFEVYSSGPTIIEPKSPITTDQIIAMETSSLVNYLQTFEIPNDNFFEDEVRGLLETVEEAVKTNPLKFTKDLTQFDTIDVGYVYHIIRGVREAWEDKPTEPWDTAWESVLEYCNRLINSEGFWKDTKTKFNDAGKYTPNKNWVVGEIGTLIKSGVRDDDNAFDPSLIPLAFEIVVKLLRKQIGETETMGDGAVTDAINSARGKCIEALINLTLRDCRLADRDNDEDHSSAWARYVNVYSGELSNGVYSSYEIPTLYALYLPQLLYISKDWVIQNFDRIFCKDDEKGWRRAMEGYAYSSVTNLEVYVLLRDRGLLLEAVDDTSLHHTVRRRIISMCCSAYARKHEKLGDETSLFNKLITRAQILDLKDIILELWRIGKNDKSLNSSLYGVISEIISKIDLDSDDGQSIASDLCLLVECYDEMDDRTYKMFLLVAPYCEIESNSYSMFIWLTKFSNIDPNRAFEIWKAMLVRSNPMHPVDNVVEIFSNIQKNGDDGIRKVRELADLYLSRGNDSLYLRLTEMLD